MLSRDDDVFSGMDGMMARNWSPTSTGSSGKLTDCGEGSLEEDDSEGSGVVDDGVVRVDELAGKLGVFEVNDESKLSDGKDG